MEKETSKSSIKKPLGFTPDIPSQHIQGNVQVHGSTTQGSQGNPKNEKVLDHFPLFIGSFLFHRSAIT